MNTATLEPEVTDEPKLDDTDIETELLSDEAASETAATSLTPWELEHYQAIQAKERAVRELEAEYLDLKESASRAKKDFDQADLELRNLIARGPDAQQKLPFPAEEPEIARGPITRVRMRKDFEMFGICCGDELDAAVNEAGILVATSEAGLTVELGADEYEAIAWAEPPPPVDPDAWRAAPVAQLGLTAKMNDILLGIGISTMGDMEDFRTNVAMSLAVWPSGIGPVKQSDIENRYLDWKDKHRETAE